jgi:opacity protein-like surface antigen
MRSTRSNPVPALSVLVMAVAAATSAEQLRGDASKDRPAAARGPAARQRPANTKPPAKPAAPTSPGTSRQRFTLTVFGFASPSHPDFDETRSFEQFAETGTLRAGYSHSTGFGGEVGLQYLFGENLGAAVALGFLTRDTSADFTGRFPHPLFLNRHREATGVVDGLSHQETAAHVDLVFSKTDGKLTYGVFGGPSFFFNVDVDVMDVPLYRHSYPFDEVSVTGTPAVGFSSSPVGFNVGGDLGYQVGNRIDLGLRVRYSRAKVELDVTDTQSVEVDAGGLQVGLGVRIRF